MSFSFLFIIFPYAAWWLQEVWSRFPGHKLPPRPSASFSYSQWSSWTASARSDTSLPLSTNKYSCRSFERIPSETHILYRVTLVSRCTGWCIQQSGISKCKNGSFLSESDAIEIGPLLNQRFSTCSSFSIPCNCQYTKPWLSMSWWPFEGTAWRIGTCWAIH